MKDHLEDFLTPFSEAWVFYQGLDPDQQRSVLLLAAIGVAALFVWAMYQAHGDRVVVVLPAGLLRILLLLLMLPFVLAGKAAGRETDVPEFLKKSWTEEPDPDGPQMPTKTVNPMRVPGGLPRGGHRAGTSNGGTFVGRPAQRREKR